MKLAFADAYAFVHDGPLPADLFADERLAARRSLVRPGAALDLSLDLPRGGTTYLCAVDGDGMAVSFIQSVYESFGSGVVAPGTGVVLAEPRRRVQSRAGPSERARAGEAPLPHDHPRHAAGAAASYSGRSASWAARCSRRATSRWCGASSTMPSTPRLRSTHRGGGSRTTASVELEPGLGHLLPELRACGHDARIGPIQHPFGVGQMILRFGSSLIGGSDGRGDGYAAGL